MVSLYTLIRFHYICPVQAARRKTSSCLTVGKPPCGRSPAVSRTRYYMVLRFAQNTFCAGQGERTLAPHCRQSAVRFTLAFCSSRCPRQQVPIRAEKCEHIVLCPTHSPRCRWAVPLRLRPLQSLRFGECLIGSLVARTPRVSGSFGHYHCALHLNPAAKVLAPAAMARHSRRLQERIRLALRCSPMLSQACPATPVADQGTLTAVNRLVLHSHSL